MTDTEIALGYLERLCWNVANGHAHDREAFARGFLSPSIHVLKQSGSSPGLLRDLEKLSRLMSAGHSADDLRMFLSDVLFTWRAKCV